MMKFISPDVATPIRGKTLPLKAKKDAGYAEVFSDEEMSIVITSSDADLVYASLVFEELNNDLSWNSDSENDTTHQEDLEVKEIKKDLSLQEILSQLALIINVEKISKFNISHSNLW